MAPWKRPEKNRKGRAHSGRRAGRGDSHPARRAGKLAAAVCFTGAGSASTNSVQKQTKSAHLAGHTARIPQRFGTALPLLNSFPLGMCAWASVPLFSLVISRRRRVQAKASVWLSGRAPRVVSRRTLRVPPRSETKPKATD